MGPSAILSGKDFSGLHNNIYNTLLHEAYHLDSAFDKVPHKKLNSIAAWKAYDWELSKCVYC